MSEARERLLRVASELFYREGITRVGIDRILREAGVTRATMYRYFDGKEQLVAAYLRREDEALRAAFPDPSRGTQAEALPRTSPEQSRAALDELLVGIADDVVRHHDRGCPFINAAAEYPDPDSEVRRIVRAHRDWFASAVRSRLALAGAPDPDTTTAAIVLLRDGALVGGYLDDPATARTAFLATARALF
ncbi:TetR/AcrR family transcriptional regulator [Herbiconiux sp. A18JL235]|uniref:TetR/AcrR family transcriptional regulator n=1 Tax=Herbiconiux sp. A18JL235 TaxID=3152363 RepID=A0AB39BEL7_9MICO